MAVIATNRWDTERIRELQRRHETQSANGHQADERQLHVARGIAFASMLGLMVWALIGLTAWMVFG